MFKKHEIPRFKERKLHRFQHVLTRRITSFSSNRIFPKQVEKQRYGFQQDGILLALTINGVMLAENIVGKWGFYNQANLAIIILLVTGFSGVSRFNGWKKKGSIKLHSLSAFAALSARWRQKQRTRQGWRANRKKMSQRSASSASSPGGKCLVDFLVSKKPKRGGESWSFLIKRYDFFVRRGKQFQKWNLFWFLRGQECYDEHRKEIQNTKTSHTLSPTNHGSGKWPFWRLNTLPALLSTSMIMGDREDDICPGVKKVRYKSETTGILHVQ